MVHHHAPFSAEYNVDMLEEVRHKNALFRLSYRTPSKIKYTDEERDIVLDHEQTVIAELRRGVKAGTYPLEWLQPYLRQTSERQTGLRVSRTTQNYELVRWTYGAYHTCDVALKRLYVVWRRPFVELLSLEEFRGFGL